MPVRTHHVNIMLFISLNEIKCKAHHLVWVANTFVTDLSAFPIITYNIRLLFKSYLSWFDKVTSSFQNVPGKELALIIFIRNNTH